MVISTKLGWGAKAYVNSGSHGSPTWVEMKPVRDVTLADSMTEVDSTTREDAGNKTGVPGLRQLGMDFDMRKDRADAAYLLIEAAYLARTSIEVLILDGSRLVSGSEGIIYTAAVIEFGEGQPLDGMVTKTVKLRPTPSAYTPTQSIIVVTPEAPTFLSTAPLDATQASLYYYKIVVDALPDATITVSGNEAWLVFDGIDVLSGTPGVGDVGESPDITITAANGTAPNATQVFKVTVVGL